MGGEERIARGDTTNRVKAVADSDKVAFAHQQRQQMTHGEKLLWRELRNRKLGVKFRRQHPIGDYILDFYSEESRLAVEVDGPHHAEQQDYDEQRDEVLNSLGISVLRLEADAVILDLAAQLHIITSRLNR